VPMIVQLLSSSASASQQLQLLAVVSALAHGSEEGSGELQEAGVAEVLLGMVAASPMPRTQVRGWMSCRQLSVVKLCVDCGPEGGAASCVHSAHAYGCLP
jgi:hypothetical protein